MITWMAGHSWRVAAIFALLAITAACSPGSHLTATPATGSAQKTGSEAQTSTSNPILTPSRPAVTFLTSGSSTPRAAQLVTATPGSLNFTNPPTKVLVKNLANPEDLFLSQDHSLYVSEIGRGTVDQLTDNGSIQVVASGLSSPEGIVSLPGGALIIAEQGKNRLEKLDPTTKELSTFVSLSNTTNQEGVDGLALDARDPAQESIIIPDSPNGVLRRAGLAGGSSTVIATGFARPTGAWVEPDGNILVVDETSGYLSRVHPDGTTRQLARFSIPDDVIEDSAGNIYVNTLGDHAVHVYTPKGQDITLLNNISDPQGLAITPVGNLVVTDPGNHQVIEIFIRGQS